jgi:hypothetical protein
LLLLLLLVLVLVLVGVLVGGGIADVVTFLDEVFRGDEGGAADDADLGSALFLFGVFI